MSDTRLATRPLPEGVESYAVWGSTLREDGTPRHRYVLTWTHPLRYGPPNLMVGMNPSGAGEDVSDLTLLKCWEFCRRWNDGTLVMTNVNPFRATDSDKMEFDPVALEWNLQYIVQSALAVQASGGNVVLAWGTPSLPKAMQEEFDLRARKVYNRLRDTGAVPSCLGATKSGRPRHPSRIGYSTPLVPWSPR